MSHIFYDVYVDWRAAGDHLKTLVENEHERHELEGLLDKVTHHEMFSTIFDTLPQRIHTEFIEAFHKAPHAGDHIIFLRRYDPDIEQKLMVTARQTHKKFFDAIHAPMVD